MNSLNKLRAKYAGKDAFTIHDENYRQVAETFFPDAKAQATWAFDHISTFLDLPFRSPDQWQGTDVGILGVPMDLGVTHRAGARFGPKALRVAERIGPYDHVLNLAPARLLSAADLGDVVFSNRFDLTQAHLDIQNTLSRLKASGILPLSVGGDHSMTLPILRALGAERPVGVIHFDAHCDTAGLFYGNQHHGSLFRQAVLDGVIDPCRTVQVGIRGPDEYFWEFSRDSGMTVIHAEAVFERGVHSIVEQVKTVVGTGPVYISVDIDSLDPSFAPGTGTPEVNGLLPRELFGMLRGLAGVNMVGGDIVEVAPQYDPTSNTANLGAQILFTLLCLATLRQNNDR
ncbi:agmatinase [Yersinia entomophaga]|uniref:Agmatinase n=1 Tax=Yersinia entomophaga TaxID=935293 RepID=A0ABM6BJ21_YERET|nr:MULTISPECIES: agmatinase [Yersinia]ANI29333.1 agmatinase [Yersinia entomophaga]OWF88336.1 agmatinase [Yersinia entomophaga]